MIVWYNFFFIFCCLAQPHNPGYFVFVVALWNMSLLIYLFSSFLGQSSIGRRRKNHQRFCSAITNIYGRGLVPGHALFWPGTGLPVSWVPHRSPVFDPSQSRADRPKHFCLDSCQRLIQVLNMTLKLIPFGFLPPFRTKKIAKL